MYKLFAIDPGVATRIRSTLKDSYGHNLKEIVLKHRALCRHCLSDGELSSPQILFSYSPFAENKTPYAEVGPVFIHVDCAPYDEGQGFPSDLKTRAHLTVRGYDERQMLLAGEMCKGLDVEDCIARMFQKDGISTVHISDASTGCFFLKAVKL